MGGSSLPVHLLRLLVRLLSLLPALIGLVLGLFILAMGPLVGAEVTSPTVLGLLPALCAAVEAEDDGDPDAGEMEVEMRELSRVEEQALARFDLEDKAKLVDDELSALEGTMEGYAASPLVTGVEVREGHDTKVGEEAGERSSGQRITIREVVDAHLLKLLGPGVVKLRELQIREPVEQEKKEAEAYDVADLGTVGRDDVGHERMPPGVHRDVLDGVRQTLQDRVTPRVRVASTDFEGVNVHRRIRTLSDKPVGSAKVRENDRRKGREERRHSRLSHTD